MILTSFKEENIIDVEEREHLYHANCEYCGQAISLKSKRPIFTLLIDKYYYRFHLHVACEEAYINKYMIPKDDSQFWLEMARKIIYED